MSRVAVTVLVSIGLLLAACGGGDDAAPLPPPQAQNQPVPGSKLGLRKFSGASACADFEAYLAESFTAQFLNGIACMAFGPCPVFLGAPGMVQGPAAGADASSAPVPERVSQTNTQEAGVDEADIVKADAAGNLYVLTGRTLVVVDAFPPAGLDQRPKAVLELGTDDFYASELILDEANARLVVLGVTYGGAAVRAIAVIVDVSNPAEPMELQRLAADGFPLAARRVGPRVHRVLRHEIPLLPAIYESAELQSRRDDYLQARSQNRDADADAIRQQVRSAIGNLVTQAGAAAFLPRLSSGAGESTLACSEVSRAEVQTGAGLAVLESFNTDGSARAVSAAVNNAYLVYGSAQNLYLAQQSVGWFFADSQAHESVIYRFALSPTDAPSYRGFGRVAGNPLGAYALSEYAGFLRVATTEMRAQGERMEALNHLSVLRASGSDLPKVGEVTGFAPGEFIRGARLLGERGFVVTFRQVDPLFAFDLSDPTQPRITSELKIPGFSSYLMPLGDEFLLTIGRAGDEQQLNGRIAIQLFDVRDMGNIRQAAVLEPAFGDDSYAWSTAEYDPHAFSYFSDAALAPTPGTLSVPVQAWSQDAPFAGFLVLRVDPAAATPLSELARLDHAGLAASNSCTGAAGGSDAPSCPDPVYAAEPRRSVFMQDTFGRYLYTLSALGLLASDAAEPSSELGRTALPYDPPQCCFATPQTGP